MLAITFRGLPQRTIYKFSRPTSGFYLLLFDGYLVLLSIDFLGLLRGTTLQFLKGYLNMLHAFFLFLWVIDNVLTFRWKRDLTIPMALIPVPNNFGGIGVSIGSTLR
jgi:hypothetical protein